MIKNVAGKIGIVTGMVVTNGIEGLKSNKLMVAVNLGVNLYVSDSIEDAIKQTIKHTGIAALVGGTVTTVLQKDEIKELFKEFDQEITEDEVIVVEDEE